VELEAEEVADPARHRQRREQRDGREVVATFSLAATAPRALEAAGPRR
jgi:hypothetical protein